MQSKMPKIPIFVAYHFSTTGPSKNSDQMETKNKTGMMK